MRYVVVVVRVCVCVRKCACASVYTSVLCAYVCVRAYRSYACICGVRVCVGVCVHVYIHAHIDEHVCICIYTRTYVCTYVLAKADVLKFVADDDEPTQIKIIRIQTRYVLENKLHQLLAYRFLFSD